MALIDGSMTFFAIDSSYKVNFVFFCHHYHDIGHHYCCYYCNLYGFLDFALRLGGAAKGLGWFLVDLCNSVSPVRGNLMTNAMRNSSLQLAALEQQKANDKIQKEELHSKIIQLDAKKSPELELGRLRGMSNVINT
ncbi:hypothetical protein WN943_018942 [Citrus x changshan-huyou]